MKPFIPLLPRLAALLLLLSCPLFPMAQTLPDIEDLLESNDITPSEEGYEEIVNTLVHLASHPVDINTAGFDSLKLLYFLSDSQIDNLLAFRARHGGFSHPNELLLVTGIGPADLANIRPFIRIGAYSPEPVPSRRIRHEIIARARATRPLQEGYRQYAPEAFVYENDYLTKKNNRYQGPPWSALLKYKLNAGDRWQAALTMESDAGEPYFTRHQPLGFDFLSAHAAYTPGNWLALLLVGDYKLQWGQGLVAWGGYTAGKSSSINNEKTARGVVPYTSTDENNYLRGAAATFRLSRSLSVDAFASHKPADGTLHEQDSLPATASLTATGYHRNALEQAKKHTVDEFTAGLAAHWNTHRFRLSLHLLHYDFSPSLTVGGQPYQQFDDNGRRRTLASVAYKTGFRSLYLFGETAVSDNGAVATVNGLRFSGLSWLSPTVVYRRYGNRYVSHYAAGFGEYSGTANEEGVYAGIECPVAPSLHLVAYHDWFRYFTPRYRATRPGHGREIMAQLTYARPRGEYRLYFKHEDKPEDQKINGVTHTLSRVKQEYRLQIVLLPSSRLELRARCALSRFRKDTIAEEGFLAYQDIVYASYNDRLKGQFRLAYFDTPSYDSRLYAYEHNVLYGFSFPAYYYRGFRAYLNLRWRPLPFATLYCKLGATYYPNRSTLSSYLSRVDANHTFDLTFQLRIKL